MKGTSSTLGHAAPARALGPHRAAPPTAAHSVLAPSACPHARVANRRGAEPLHLHTTTSAPLPTTAAARPPPPHAPPPSRRRCLPIPHRRPSPLFPITSRPRASKFHENTPPTYFPFTFSVRSSTDRGVPEEEHKEEFDCELELEDQYREQELPKGFENDKSNLTL
uniref:Uncharacterized protein n=1 Tax=Setaria viridis TaxID=4556 RepID=A0A4U6TCT5_SETVI|nr:hypothetical protein SEVIR_9G331400v2 [Setaria viridis]